MKQTGIELMKIAGCFAGIFFMYGTYIIFAFLSVLPLKVYPNMVLMDWLDYLLALPFMCLFVWCAHHTMLDMWRWCSFSKILSRLWLP